MQGLGGLKKCEFYSKYNVACVYVCVCTHTHSLAVSNFLGPHGLQPTRFPCPWDFPGKSSRIVCHFLLQEIFPTQASNMGLLRLLHCRQILYLCAPGKLLQLVKAVCIFTYI